MGFVRWSFAALLLLSSSTAAQAQASLPQPAPGWENRLLVRSVAIVDPAAGTVSPPRDILIIDGRIASIAEGADASVSDELEVVDGRGLFALAGLIDVHAHVGEGGAAPNSDESRRRALRQFLRYGVTTIFVPGATGAGDSDLPSLLQRCRSGELSCPGVYGSGSILTARGSHPLSTIFGMPDDVAPHVTESRGVTVVTGATDIPALIARKQKNGATAIKIVVEDGPPSWYPKPRLTDEQIRAIVSAAHERSLPVVAHISTSQQVSIVAGAGVDAIMHAPTDLLPPEVVRTLADKRIWYVPTFSLYDGIVDWARGERESDPYALAGVEPSVLESLADRAFLDSPAEDEEGALKFFSAASANLRLVNSAGVPIALGTDVNNPFVYPGYSVHEELSLMVEAGLTAAEALGAATTGGAAFLGEAQRVGQIAPGYEGDLILLARNPLDRVENTRSIVFVISDGEVITDVIALK
jgi:imidazolonepropionase-like amidohydrolase